MISLSDLVTVSPVSSAARSQQPAANQPGRSTSGRHDGDHLTAHQDFWCPPAGTQLSVNKDFSMSASTRSVARVAHHRRHSGHRLGKGLYFGAFHRSALYPLLTRINASLMRWLGSKKRQRLRG